MHMLEGEVEGGGGNPKSADADAGTHKQAETHAVICCPCRLVGWLVVVVFSCLAFHVQSLACEFCISAEDRGKTA